jgi:hypothetical protein
MGQPLNYLFQKDLAKVSGREFADQKSRGFHIHKSHIADPQRLSRLLIAACLAYIEQVA